MDSITITFASVIDTERKESHMNQCQLVKIFENRINGLNIRNKVSFWNDSWSKWRG